MDMAAKIPEEGLIEQTTTYEQIHLQHDKDAALGVDIETHLTLGQAANYYRKAIAWSVVISMAAVMDSYDIILLNSFYAFPQFVKKFGQQLPDGTYNISSQWQVGLTLGMVVGLIPGSFLSGALVDRFGYKRTMFGAHICLIGLIFIPFFASRIEILFVGLVLMAMPCGLFAVTASGYAAEVCPMALRGYLTTYVNLCWIIGHLIAAGVLTSKLNDTSQWSYRVPFAIQWLWPPLLAVACCFCPESPWWLVKKGRSDAALKTLDSIISAPETVIDKQKILAMMEHTIQAERDMQIGGRYLDCFKGTNRQRSEIAMISWGCQILPGFVIQNYIAYFFKLAGLSSGDTFKLTLGTYSIAFVGTVLSWFIQTRFGRRTMFMTGMAMMLVPMLLVGFLDLAPMSSKIRWARSALLLVWFFCYGSTIGPIPYAIAAEVGATRLRTKTLALARVTYCVLSIINTVISPYMLNATAGNLRGKAAFPAAGFTVLLLVWAYFRLPETKHMMPETLDRLFYSKVSARKFKEEAYKYQ